jgi:Fe-S oxidoreductase/nitrate reductase gamma subunit
MWNVPHWAELVFYLLIPIVVLGFAAGVAWRVRKWFLGRPEPGVDNLWTELRRGLAPARLLGWLTTAVLQSRLRSDGFALLMHQAIFWGMVVLFIGTALATIDQDVAHLIFDTQVLRGGFYQFFELALDIFGVALLVGVGMAAYRRWWLRPPRLATTVKGISFWDGFPFLTVLATIAITGFLVEGLRLAEGMWLDGQLAAVEGPEARLQKAEELGLRERFAGSPDRQQAQLQRIAAGGEVFPAARWAPLGMALAKPLAMLPVDALRGLHQVFWWGHALLAFGLILAVPLTKAFHLFSAPANLLLRSTEPAGKLIVAVESGVKTVRDFTWRQLLQLEACTWCGRCHENCPANLAGWPLSPRNLVQALDAQLLRTPLKRDGEPGNVHGRVVQAGELWSCCTCRACEQVCPALIQQPRLIVDLRRHLVDGGQVDEGLQDALMNLQRYGNSQGQSARKRPDWTKSLPFALKDARKTPVDLLWFTGDYAAYDQRAREVTRKIAVVLHAAGEDVGLLWDKEQNSGNDVRRCGEEGLFAMLREKNLKELAAATFRRVFTTDPHTYNTLKNEYLAADSADAENPLRERPVLHYTELFDELLRVGALRVVQRASLTVAYHDPCYLGRYNGVYEAPRRVLSAIGARLVEMPRNRENSFCCGAGGGRIWMKDVPAAGERPAENRIKEVLALPEVECLVVACPKDLVMFQDAVKTLGVEARLRVADLGELVHESTQAATPNDETEEIAQP